ncbi:MAG: ABC transporter ATP-binding protein, partial [Kordiimonadaceae bacterium]|nr:ABC transporter ATP-binding protein [Kordiimonadaceae bacterium]
MTPALLSVNDLTITFPSAESEKSVVRNVSFDIKAGEVLAVVGESGSGKTMVARSVLGLLPSGGKVSGGSIDFQGKNLANLSQKTLQSIRGTAITMIFQEPMVSLNPALKIGYQMCEAAKHHTKMSAAEIRARAVKLLERVHIKDPENCLNKYP